MIQGRHLYLKEFGSKDDYLFIFQKFNCDDLFLWSNRNKKQTLDEFNNEMNHLIKNDYRSLKIIFENYTNKRIGFMFAYKVRNWDSHAFVTIYISDEYRKTLYSIEAGILYVHHIFEDLKINKIFFEIYSYNTYSIDIMRFPGVIKEATLKDFRRHNDEYYDLYIYSITKEDFMKNSKLLEAVK